MSKGDGGVGIRGIRQPSEFRVKTFSRQSPVAEYSTVRITGYRSLYLRNLGMMPLMMANRRDAIASYEHEYGTSCSQQPASMLAGTYHESQLETVAAAADEDVGLDAGGEEQVACCCGAAGAAGPGGPCAHQSGHKHLLVAPIPRFACIQTIRVALVLRLLVYICAYAGIKISICCSMHCCLYSCVGCLLV